MDFGRSTQATCWMFDKESLMECKEDASMVESVVDAPPSKPKVRKFACGFQEKASKTSQEEGCSSQCPDRMPAKMACCDQEILVHFHAHQIQRLVGPNAIFPELRRSASVLSTAIMIFRRFYLSNSVIDFHPRNIATASALLAVKVDCERRLEVSPRTKFC
jgi:cyclin H